MIPPPRSQRRSPARTAERSLPTPTAWRERLPTTGVIKPGTVLRYVDDAQALRLGIVRSTAITQQFPVLTQSLEIDSHA